MASLIRPKKNAHQLERHFKGMANHYRIEILLLVNQQPGITVEEISEQLGANFKTISQHTRYLVQAGLLNKKYVGRTVTHTLSPYGKFFAKFIDNFKNHKFTR